MSVYNFLPEPNTPSRVTPYATWVNGFTDEEIERIISYCESNLAVDKAIVGGLTKDAEYSEVRKSKTAWVKLNGDTQWIYDRLAYISRVINGQNWQFDLTGFVEDLQFTVYDSDESHYTWHADTITSREISQPRKLSLVMQLTDPSEYEGGDLEMMYSPNITTVPKEKGLITFFPSYMLHRVTPVTKGTRRTLVVWISGPPFK